MTRNQILDRMQVFLDLASALVTRVRAGADYIGFLLVADESTPMFPGSDLSLQG